MQCWQYYTSSKRDKSMWMAILQGWVGQGLAGRRRKTFKVWKMCLAVVGIRANPKLMLWAVSKYWVKPCLFWILFCTFGWLPGWRWDKMTFAHEQTDHQRSQGRWSQSLVLQAEHEQISIDNLGSEIFPNDQVPKVKGSILGRPVSFACFTTWVSAANPKPTVPC